MVFASTWEKLSPVRDSELGERIMSNTAIRTLRPTRFPHPLFCALLSCILLLLAIGSAAQAGTAITETTGVGNLGTHILPPSGNVYGIIDGTPVGNNLYHSFAQFSVGSMDTAQFQTTTLVSNSTVSNILARVTGVSPSSIFGTVDSISYYPNANLFLMNPYGIVFGPSAALNVGGSVAFTTANYLRLDGSPAEIFHADTTSTSLLTSASVAAFGFLGTNPAAISLQGSTLNVQPGHSISLVGGNEGFTYTNPDTAATATVPGGVTMTGGTLSAPSGQILIASVASPGEILHQSFELAPNVNGDSFTSLGAVSISQGGILDASGSPGGTVRIRSGEFVLDGSLIFSNTTGNVLDSASTAVQIYAQGDAIVRNASAIVSSSDGAKRSGDIEIKAGTVSVLDGSAIVSGSSGSAPASNILITASSSVSLTGTDPFGSGVGSTITSDSLDFCGCTEPSGGVSITASSLTLDDQAIIQTRAFGDRPGGSIALDLENLIVKGGSAIQALGGEFSPAGNITIAASDTILLSGRFDSDTPSRIANINEGLAGTGSILIETGNLLLEKGARIRNEALASLEANQDPKITIHATNTVSLSGEANIRVLNIASDVGGIDISGRSITLTDQSVIRTETSGNGNAGPINIAANDLSILSGSTVESSTFFNAGLGGNITINLTGTLSLNGQAIGQSGEVVSSNISSRTTGSGDGGQITISANLTEISGGALINTSTALGTGNAGSVTIKGPASPAQSVLIDGVGSGIFTDTQDTGAGGNIFVNANSVTLQNGGTLSAKTSGTEATAIGGTIIVTATNQVTMTGGASISASSTGAADAGNITINAGNRFELQNSSVTTNSEHAGGGNVEINATDQIRLVNSLVNASAYLNGGNITIDPNLVILQNSQILAQAVQGAGGNITITTPLFLADQTSFVSASSQFGLNGTVTIQSPTSNLSGSVGSLPSSISQQQALQAQRCAALSGGASSSFIIAGRDSIPTEPGGWLTRPLGLHSLGGGLRAETTIDEQQPTTLVMAQSSKAISLRRLTPAGFLIERFAGNGSDGCRS